MFSTSSILISKRTLRPIIWNLLLQGTFLNMFIFVVNADIFHPVKWFYDWYVNFIWQGSWMYIIPLTILVIGQGSASTEDYIQTQPLYATRISLVQQVFTVHNILVGGLHVVVGCLVPWTYSSLVGPDYESFRQQCFSDEKENCFSEKRLFLVLGGMFINTIYFFQSHFLGTRYLQFPIVPLPKLLLVKSHLFETIQSSMKWVIVPDIIFMCIYYLKGGSLRNYLSLMFSLPLDAQPVDSLSGLFNIQLLSMLFLFSTLTIVSMRMMDLFFNVCLTERYQFSLFLTEDKENPVLTDGLKMSESPITQHLAFLDLMLLCEHSKARRGEIFKLSSFGGHPHLWNAVKKECISLIDNFCNELSGNLKSKAVEKPSDILLRKPLMRRNVPDYFADETTPVAPVLMYQTEESTYVEEDIFFIYYEKLKKLPFMVYFFGDRKDMRIRHTLRHSLLVKWACESISFLACHSLKEDDYGILVNDLPIIISSLLHIKHNIDSLIKQTALASTLSRQDQQNSTEASALKKSVKRSIYRIVNTFKYYISDIHLPKEVESQLMPYICYRE